MKHLKSDCVKISVENKGKTIKITLTITIVQEINVFLSLTLAVASLLHVTMTSMVGWMSIP